MTLTCVKFGTDQINIFEVASRKTKRPPFFDPPCVLYSEAPLIEIRDVTESPSTVTFASFRPSARVEI